MNKRRDRRLENSLREARVRKVTRRLLGHADPKIEYYHSKRSIGVDWVYRGAWPAEHIDNTIIKGRDYSAVETAVAAQQP